MSDQAVHAEGAPEQFVPGVYQASQSLRYSSSIASLTGALAKAQGEFGKVLKDITAKIQTKNGGSYSYQYADLASVLEAIRKPLADHGLAIMQPTSCNGDKVNITTILSHESGEWISSSLVLPVEPNNDRQPFVQAVGSTVTYGKRYALCGLLGISSEADDDGNNTGPRSNATRPNGVNRQPPAQQPQNQQTRTESSEELNRKYNNPNRANAPAAKQEQPKPEESKPASDPVDTLKKTLFRKYSCKTKEDCDVILGSITPDEPKGLDHFASHPELCLEVLDVLGVQCTTLECKPEDLLSRIIEARAAAAAI